MKKSKVGGSRKKKINDGDCRLVLYSPSGTNESWAVSKVLSGSGVLRINKPQMFMVQIHRIFDFKFAARRIFRAVSGIGRAGSRFLPCQSPNDPLWTILSLFNIEDIWIINDYLSLNGIGADFFSLFSRCLFSYGFLGDRSNDFIPHVYFDVFPIPILHSLHFPCRSQRLYVSFTTNMEVFIRNLIIWYL